MPYIKKERRDDMLIGIRGDTPRDAGELNYCFTAIAIAYWNLRGHRYQHINDIIGALEGAKLEFYRRAAAEYEIEKIKENGDVF